MLLDSSCVVVFVHRNLFFSEIVFVCLFVGAQRFSGGKNEGRRWRNHKYVEEMEEKKYSVN
jgi:hypothetical protein